MFAKQKIIVWDLGATKCAAAMVSYDSRGEQFFVQKSCVVKIHSVDSLVDLVDAIEDNLKIKHHAAQAICIGAAGIYDNDVLTLYKKYPYPMPIGKIAKTYKWPPLAVVHDYTLTLCSTFTPHIEYKKINDHECTSTARRIAFGVGTGLGLKDGVRLPHGDIWLGTNEAGHIGISEPLVASKIIYENHRKLMSEKGLTFEDVLSGQGLLAIHKFLNAHTIAKTPEEVGRLIHEHKAQETLSLFAFYLGLFTATVQLSFMPFGGIWITGGIIKKHIDVFDCPEFLDGINALPAYLKERQKIPLRALTDKNAAFIGGALYLVKKHLLSE